MSTDQKAPLPEAVREPSQLAIDLRVRADCLSGVLWEVPATAAMMREAADTIERLDAAAQQKRG